MNPKRIKVTKHVEFPDWACAMFQGTGVRVRCCSDPPEVEGRRLEVGAVQEFEEGGEVIDLLADFAIWVSGVIGGAGLVYGRSEKRVSEIIRNWQDFSNKRIDEAEAKCARALAEAHAVIEKARDDFPEDEDE